MLVFAIHQHKSTTGIYAPSQLNLPPVSYPIPPVYVVTGHWVDLLCHTAISHWRSILQMIICMLPCRFLSLSHPLLPTLCPQVCSLCLCLYSCSANRFISTIFLDSIFSIYIGYLFLLFMTYFILYNSL